MLALRSSLSATQETQQEIKGQQDPGRVRLLLKRRQLKGKKVVILEDMAQDLAKRLKKLKEKHSVDSAWFTNGKIKYKLKDDPRIAELKEWKDL